MNLIPLSNLKRTVPPERHDWVSSPRIRASGPNRKFQLHRVSDAIGRLSKLLGLARCLGATLIAAGLTASAQVQSSVTLAWDPSPGNAIAGYRLYVGVASRTYTNIIDVGNVTTNTVTGLAGGVTYFFAATAYDTNGLESDYSSEVRYAVPRPTNNAPIIALATPADGTSYAAPASISLAASVTANGHTISQVQFYNGATLLGTVAAVPYSFSWNNVIAGTYSLTAQAVYDSGSTVASTSANVAVTNASGSGAVTFGNPSAITIPDSGAGMPYPSTIDVSGMGGMIDNVTLTLANLSHTWVSDIDVLLVGPAGQKVLVFANVGDAFAANNVTVTLSDAAASALPRSGSLVTGTYQPTSYAPATTFPSPAPTGPYATTLSTLNGQSANGMWSLYVFDDGPYDEGSFSGGWSLTVSTTGAVPTVSDIANQSTTVDTATPAVQFTVDDTDTPVASLTLSGGSSNPTLVPTDNIVFGGSGGHRTVTVSPTANQAGTATITVSVSDGTSSASDTFVLTVTNPPPTVALTSPTNGASYMAPATAELVASVTANGHALAKVQFYDGATLLGEVTSAPYSLIWSNVNAGSYSLSALAVYDASSLAPSSPVNIVVMGLPAPWQTADIGSVGAVGGADVSNDLYMVEGAGNISGTADNFRFVYQPLSGDGEIKVCLNSVADTGMSGRIGVIIRESLTSGSEYAFMGISPDGTFRWQRRRRTGGGTSSTISTVGTTPNAWTRLVRTGNTIYGYNSTDGTNWTEVNSRNFMMATNIYVGLAVASGTSNALNSATFTNVTVIP
jgi:subtilisin-like proprotein convertase family protein